MKEFTAPVQIVVDTDKLLDQIGWRSRGYDSDGDPCEETGPAELRRDLATEVAKILALKLREEMKSVVRKVIAEIARDRAATIVDDVLTAGFRKTNSYGEPVGDPVTLRELVVAEVSNQLTRQVDESGRTPDGYGRTRMSYVQYVARTAAAEALRGELGAAAAAAVDEVKAGVTAMVAEELGKKIVRAVTG
ncbi:hypothetical protein [Nocardia sp. NPDC052566]|uniref:hypothetical protein n=1 Tax=Nocardia sp. NPDC052566 TaxID=3364330 RepID=UPI0037CAD347